LNVVPTKKVMGSPLSLVQWGARGGQKKIVSCLNAKQKQRCLPQSPPSKMGGGAGKRKGEMKKTGGGGNQPRNFLLRIKKLDRPNAVGNEENCGEREESGHRGCCLNQRESTWKVQHKRGRGGGKKEKGERVSSGQLAEGNSKRRDAVQKPAQKGTATRGEQRIRKLQTKKRK